MDGYPSPSATGRIPFVPPGAELECETFYMLWGSLESQVPPLICLHGGPGCPGRYLLPLALLQRDHGTPVLLYDQIGCGDSTHLRDRKGDMSFWTFELFFAELNNLISHLGIKQYDLLGHSWGGMLAAKFALTQPSGLRKLILSSTSANIQLRLKATARQMAELPADARETIERCTREGTTSTPEYRAANLEFYKRHMCRAQPLPQAFLDSVAMMEQDDTVHVSLYGTLPLSPSGLLKDFDISPELGQITEKTVPGGILILNGKYDTTQDEVTAPFFTKTRARVKWIRFADQSHMGMLEEPKAYNAAVHEFLVME